jgi:hypothetical protein
MQGLQARRLDIGSSCLSERLRLQLLIGETILFALSLKINK